MSIKKNCPSCFVLHRPTECPSQDSVNTVTITIPPMLPITITMPKPPATLFRGEKLIPNAKDDGFFAPQLGSDIKWSKPVNFGTGIFNPNIKWDTLPVTNWPADRRLPSTEEVEAAKQRYLARVEKAGVDNLCCGGDFNRVMNTFSSTTWLHFFFPDDPTVPKSWPYGKLKP